MWRLIYYLYNRIWPASIEVSTREDLDDDWIALTSSVEVRTAETLKESIASELERLRSANLSNRFSMILRHLKSQHPTIDCGNLTPDLRYSLFKTLYTKLSPVWLELIREEYPQIDVHWYPTTYEKNILGQIVDVSLQTSNDDLNHETLAHIIRRVHLSIVGHLTSGKLPSDRLVEKLLGSLLQSIPSPLVEMWKITSERTQKSLSKQGTLQQKWQDDDRKERDRLQLIKERGADAKYDPKKEEPSDLLSPQEMHERRKKLETVFVKKSLN